MKRLSEKLTRYIIRTGAASKESYEIYQYGFQIGLEILCCFMTCLIIAIYMHMIPEFIVFTVVFIMLRTYAGGVHLASFLACFICSAVVQTLTLFINSIYKFTVTKAWIIIIIASTLIFRLSPVDSINKELNNDEKVYCKKVTMKLLMGVLILSGGCTLGKFKDMVSLIALTILVILISQYIGIIKYKIEKRGKRK